MSARQPAAGREAGPAARSATSPGRARLERSPRLHNLALFALGWFLLLLAGVSYWLVLQPVLLDGRDQDFLFFYMGARIGVEHGWQHLYDLPLQQAAFSQLRPGHPPDVVSRFLNPPPLAWLALPFSLLPVAAGFVAWDALQLIALGATWRLAAPGTRAARLVLLLAALAWYPVVVALRTGQPALFLLLLITLSWYLLERGRPWLAGGVLALAAIKPSAILLAGPVLLLGGRGRAFAGWALVSTVLVGLSLVQLGTAGARQFLDLLATAHGVPGAKELTLASVFGPGPVSTAAQLAVAGVTLVLAWRHRSGPAADLYTLAIVGSLLCAPYVHAHDAPILLLAFWLSLRRPIRVAETGLMLAVGVAYELVNLIGPLPLLAGLALWLGMLAWRRPQRTKERVAEPATLSSSGAVS